MWTRPLIEEYEPDEYAPLLLQHHNNNFNSDDNDDDDDNSSISSNASTTSSILLSNEKHDWLFDIINWDEIFLNAASYLNINFNDYDYDRYNFNQKNKNNRNNLTNTNHIKSNIDTFNYFMSTLSNGTLNMVPIPLNNQKNKNKLDSINNNIYNIIYDRVAKSRLYSLKYLFDQIYPSLNVNRILVEIINYELAPDTIRHLLYKSIINKFNSQCHPSFYKKFILIFNWIIYILFFAIHIIWLQYVWIDFLKHFNWNDNDKDGTHGGNGGHNKDGDAGEDSLHDINIDNPLIPPVPNDQDPNYINDINNQILAKGLSIANASPLNIFYTISQWGYFQWITFGLFVLIIVYMIGLYFIARRVDAFGDFLQKLQLTKLLEISKPNTSINSINYGTYNDNDVDNNDNDNVLMPFINNNQNTDDDIHLNEEKEYDNDNDNDDNDSELFSSSDLDCSESESNHQSIEWNDDINNNINNDKLMLTSSGRIDILSHKLCNKIELIYYDREHLILYTVISLVKMLIILLYISCLVGYFIIPNPSYWYLWCVLFYIFTVYIIFKSIKSVIISHIYSSELFVAFINIISVSLLLIFTTYIISIYLDNYSLFISNRLYYLEILSLIEIIWFLSQFILWKLSYYGTIFYLLLLIPSILFGSSSFYALYEYYILSLVHIFLAIIFSCGEFHLVGPHNDDTTLDPSDWSVLGILALLAKLFKFRMPQQQPTSININDH